MNNFIAYKGVFHIRHLTVVPGNMHHLGSMFQRRITLVKTSEFWENFHILDLYSETKHEAGMNPVACDESFFYGKEYLDCHLRVEKLCKYIFVPKMIHHNKG